VLKSKVKGLAETFQSAIDQIPEDSASIVGQLHYWIPQPWDNKNGRVTLAGDAAHSMFICESTTSQLSLVPAVSRFLGS
jgi:hypothetical protein